ncbi:DgyrCDS1617 [Dimorphilus gyrociliatus]|uniref:DgyrCDS1617 n=1 Tax=Dimorphilus gyrociliatus TaxID=2664684 RepID=A0A7I8V9Q5_9ANNE|nr:DgyrCDS1617 [Dimorphilus gyrociliatus]
MPLIEIGQHFKKWTSCKKKLCIRSNEEFAGYLLYIYETFVDSKDRKITQSSHDSSDNAVTQNDPVKENAIDPNITDLQKGMILDFAEPCEIEICEDIEGTNLAEDNSPSGNLICNNENSNEQETTEFEKNLKEEKQLKRKRPKSDGLCADQTEVKCAYCDFIASNRKEYSQHRIENHPKSQLSRIVKDPVICDKCGKVLQNKYKYWGHKRACHSTKEYKCQRKGCNFITRSHSGLYQHENSVHAERRHLCSQCGKCFKRPDALRIHVRTHTGEKPYSCPHCDKKFADMSTRTDHLVRKHKDLEGRSIFCDVCQKPFRTLAAKERHQEKKSCAKNGMKTSLLACKYDDCNYSTRYHNSLRYHVKSAHEKLKSFKCKSCSKAFTSKHQVLRHEETHDNNRERYECKECNKTFLRIGALERHRKQQHLKNTPHKCRECGLGFVYPSQLKQHMYKHKGIKPYKCRFCSSFFQHVATAWSHEHRVHKEEWKRIGHTLGPLKPVEDEEAEVITISNITSEAVTTVPVQINQSLLEGVSITNILNLDLAGKCHSVCENTFPLHTYEKATHLVCCKRGCRLYSVIDFVKDSNEENSTLNNCLSACKEAYQDKGEREACTLGCAKQKEFNKRESVNDEEIGSYEFAIFYPVTYIHDMYKNAFDKMASHIQISWTYLAQTDESGRTLIIQSGPTLEFDPASFDIKTSNILETNLAEVDKSATEDIKMSQLINSQETETSSTLLKEREATLLACIARKTGLSRLILSLTLFLSAVFMLWLCFNSAATAPEHKINHQLSINGDLNYLNSVEKKYLKEYMQEKLPMAAPLPVKINFQTV